jgi:hypothetical protein
MARGRKQSGSASDRARWALAIGVVLTAPVWIEAGCGSSSTSGGSGGAGPTVDSGVAGAELSDAAGSAGASVTDGAAGNNAAGAGGIAGSGGNGGQPSAGSAGSGGLQGCSFYAPNGSCPMGLKCRCCMTLGAHSCTCSTACAGDGECTDPARKSCVEKAFGFCAPTADFCSPQ